MALSSYRTSFLGLWLASLWAGLETMEAFQIPVAKPTASSAALYMGLYDTPLPPRPGSSNNDDDEKEEDDEQPPEVTQRLFSMQDDGKEAQNLLPPLGRRLDLGIGCYFEATDRQVVNLAKQAGCHPSDAAWALEACKGDSKEAWTCLSVAQRFALEAVEVELRQSGDQEADEKENDDPLYLEKTRERDAAYEAKKKAELEGDKEPQKPAGIDMDDVKADLYDLLREEEFEEMKEQRMKDREYQKRMDMFKSAGKDAQWLPTENPRPIDDEPWFTG